MYWTVAQATSLFCLVCATSFECCYTGIGFYFLKCPKNCNNFENSKQNQQQTHDRHAVVYIPKGLAVVFLREFWDLFSALAISLLDDKEHWFFRLSASEFQQSFSRLCRFISLFFPANLVHYSIMLKECCCRHRQESHCRWWKKHCFSHRRVCGVAVFWLLLPGLTLECDCIEGRIFCELETFASRTLHRMTYWLLTVRLCNGCFCRTELLWRLLLLIWWCVTAQCPTDGCLQGQPGEKTYIYIYIKIVTPQGFLRVNIHASVVWWNVALLKSTRDARPCWYTLVHTRFTSLSIRQPTRSLSGQSVCPQATGRPLRDMDGYGRNWTDWYATFAPEPKTWQDPESFAKVGYVCSITML